MLICTMDTLQIEWLEDIIFIFTIILDLKPAPDMKELIKSTAYTISATRVSNCDAEEIDNHEAQ